MAVPDTETARSNRPSSRDFGGRQGIPDMVEVTTPAGPVTIDIPAQFRSCYWAILRYMYQNADQPVQAAELCEGVQQIMSQSDAMKWQRFQKGGRVVRSPDDWQRRLILNAKNLCRLNGAGAYGRRLVEMGHVLRCETRDDRLYFKLSTTITPEDLAPRKPGRKPRRSSSFRHDWR